MKRILVAIAILLLPAVGCAWTISWDHVTRYTDNTVIDDDSVVYNVYIDGTKATTVPDNTYTFSASRGLTRTYTVNAELVRQRTVSDNASMQWAAPTGKPNSAGPFRFR